MRRRPLLALLLATAACARSQVPSAEGVARVGGEEVGHPRFVAYLERNLGEEGSALPSEVLSALFDQFLDELVLERLALERGLIADGDDGRRAAAALLAAAADAWRPGADEIAAYYRQHEADFSHPARVRLRQILVEERAVAERARDELSRGADFGELARRLSQEPGAVFGGDQGELSRSELPPAFADVIFALAPGEVSEIVAADYGFHLFQVTERLAPRQLTLDEAAPEIVQTLSRQAREAQLAELVREARNRYTPEVYERNLPFNYSGRYRHEPSS